MEDRSKQEWLKVLQAVSRSRPHQSNGEWEWLMKELGMGPEYFLAIYEAIQQGRWRAAENPRAYIKTVAKRQALKMGLLREQSDELVLVEGSEVDGEEAGVEETLEFINYQQGSREAVKSANGVWRAGPGWKPDYEEPRSYREALRAAIPDELAEMEHPPKGLAEVVERINRSTDEFHIHLKPLKKPEWKKWAEAAGFDKWEQKVLKYRRNKTSRDKA